MSNRAAMSLVMPIEKKNALKEYCELYSLSFNQLCNDLLDKFMASKKFTKKPKVEKVKVVKPKAEKKVAKKKVVKKKVAKKKVGKKKTV